VIGLLDPEGDGFEDYKKVRIIGQKQAAIIVTLLL
jgi:hypothetical protein